MSSAITSNNYRQLPYSTTNVDIIAVRDFELLHNLGIIDQAASVSAEIKFIPGNTVALDRFTSSLHEIFGTIQNVIGPIPARLLGTNILAILGWDFIETCSLQFDGKRIHLLDHLSQETIAHAKNCVANTPHEFTLFFDISSAPKDALSLLRNVLSGTCSEEVISDTSCQELTASFNDISIATYELEYIELYSGLAQKPRQFLSAFKGHPKEFAFTVVREFEGTPQTIRLLFGKTCPYFVTTTRALEVIHDTSSVLAYNDLAADWYVDTLLGYVRVSCQGTNKEEIIYSHIKLGMDARGQALDTLKDGIFQDDVTTWHAFLHLSTKNSCGDVLLLAQIAHQVGAPVDLIHSFIKHAKPRSASTALWQIALTFCQDGTLSFTEWQHVMQCLAITSSDACYINTLSKPYLLLQSGQYTLRFDLELERAFSTFSNVFTKLSTHKNFTSLIEALAASRKTRLEPNHILTNALNLQALDLPYFAHLIINSCSKHLHPTVLEQFIPTRKSCSSEMLPALLQLIEVVLLQHGYPLNAEERTLLKDDELFEFSWVHILQKCQNTTCTRIGFEAACKKINQLVDEKDLNLDAIHKWFHLLPDTAPETFKTGFLLLDLCRLGDGHEARSCKVVDKILRNYNATDYPPFHFIKFCHAYKTLVLPTIGRLAQALNALQDSKSDYILMRHLVNSEIAEVQQALFTVANRIIKDPSNPALQEAKKFLHL